MKLRRGLLCLLHRAPREWPNRPKRAKAALGVGADAVILSRFSLQLSGIGTGSFGAESERTGQSLPLQSELGNRKYILMRRLSPLDIVFILWLYNGYRQK